MSRESKRRGRKKQKRLQKAREAARLLGARSTTRVCSVCGIFRTLDEVNCDSCQRALTNDTFKKSFGKFSK